MSEAYTKPEGILSLQTIAMPADTNWSGDVFGGGSCHKWTWLEQFTRSVLVVDVVLRFPLIR